MHIPVNIRRFFVLGLTIIMPAGFIVAQEVNITTGDSIRQQDQPIHTSFLNREVHNGYSVNKIKYITGSVSIIKPDVLLAIPAGNVSNLLQGRASGVTVAGSGQPGETSKVRIRGFSSFLNNNPLYVVDGVPTQDISLINPYDIASVTILKDAGAASIYGSRASNGVIIVTTKSGDRGFHVTYDMSMGIQNPGKGTEGNVLDTKEYANLQWLEYKNDGAVDIHPLYGSSQNPAPSIPAWAANTDWYDAITHLAGIQNHNLSISGSSENAGFYAGVGVFRQDGIIIYTNNTRYNARLNSHFRFFNGRLKAGENFNVSSRTNLSVPNLDENSPVLTGPYRSQSIIPVVIIQPISGLAHNFVPGEWGGTGIAPRLGNYGNPVADLTRRKDDRSKNTFLAGNIFLDLTMVEGLSFRSILGGTWDEGSVINNTYATYERSENLTNTILEENRFTSSDWVWTNLLTLDKQFGQHKILAVAGYEAVNYGIGQTKSSVNTIKYTPTRLLSTFIKADYAFMEKYMFGATLRRDGCSRFSESHRFGMFPSFSAGWRIGDEPFLDGLDWISDLKIRGSWGKTGNQFALSPQNSVFLFGESIGGSWYDLYGTFNSPVRGYYPLRIANPDATWETNTTTDIGFDAGLFDSRIKIVFDWYSKRANDLLYNPPLPGTAGSGEAPYVNIASMKNSGVDIEFSYQNSWNNLGFNASVIFTTYNNKISGIANGIKYFNTGITRMGSLVRNETGHSLSSFYGYKVLGLFQSYEEVANAPTQDGAEPGFFKFANFDDINSGGFPYIDSYDRTFIGDPNPKFTYGFNLALTWKNLDLTAFIYGSKGNDIFNNTRWWTDFWQSYQGQKSKDLLYNSWTETNKNAKIPKASNHTTSSTNTQNCSYYIEDGSYLRLKNLQVGYTVPKNLTDKIKISSLRVYLQAVNIFTLTKYSGLDPEIGGDDLAFGIDYGNYPSAKQFIIGVNLSL